MSVRSTRLTRALLASGVQELRGRDAALDRVVTRHGAPPMWGRPTGFETLVQIILEQQVSLASGRAGWMRLVALTGSPTADRIAGLTPRALRTAGLTRQKAEYIHLLAVATARGEFDPARLRRLGDDDARAALVALKGIGPWSADVYLLMALRRADAWPAGDLALQIAAMEVKRLRTLPTAKELERMGEQWRPWRAVAARILWRHYLSTDRARRR